MLERYNLIILGCIVFFLLKYLVVSKILLIFVSNKNNNNMKQFNVTNIVWDTDEENLDLPTEELVECDNEEHISDTLSDKYGWCIESFTIN